MRSRPDGALLAPLLTFHRRLWIRELERRTLAWALATLALLALWTCLCLLFALPRGHYYSALLTLLTLLPAFLFWPLPRGFFLLPLRAADRAAAIETWLETRREAQVGPAASLIEGAARERLAELALDGPRRSSPLRGLLPLALAALLSLGLLELASFLVLGKPSLLYAGPAAEGGSGLKLDRAEGAQPAPAEPSAAEAGSLPDRKEAALEAAGRSEGLASRDLAPEALRLAMNEAGIEGRSLARGGAPEVGQAGEQPRPEGEIRSGGAASGQPIPADSSRTRGGAAESGRGATGYEGSGKSGVPSPLLDYRTKGYELPTSPAGLRSSASGDLAKGETPAVRGRSFGGFVLDTGIRPREDAYLALLRRRWAELNSAASGPAAAEPAAERASPDATGGRR